MFTSRVLAQCTFKVSQKVVLSRIYTEYIHFKLYALGKRMERKESFKIVNLKIT